MASEITTIYARSDQAWRTRRFVKSDNGPVLMLRSIDITGN
jgi:hypothetical protein